MRKFFMKTKRIGFSKWNDADLNLATQLWGDKEVTQFICATGMFTKQDIIHRLETEIQNDKLFHIQYWPIFELSTEESPDVVFMPEIALNSFTPIDKMNSMLEQFLDQHYFKSLDMYGDETALCNFKKMFKIAKEKGLILKAHVGEFGSAELVREVVEELELDQVQHGIAAANSKSVMKWLCDNKIQLNVCLSSNVFLCRVLDFKTHPIRKLHDNGIKVTINTDDMLIFNQSISDEFFNLYYTGLFNATELNEIRGNGLSVIFHT